MWGILSKVFLVVIVILAIPTTLILVSQNANPGDGTYPVKRGMENGLGRIFSLNPITAAYFKTDLSNRRFKEAVTVLKKQETDQTQANTSLVELLSTTANASADINQVSDPTLKKRLAVDLSNQIAVYRQNLSQVAKETKQLPTAPVVVTVTPTATPQPQPTTAPTNAPGVTRPPAPTPIPTPIPTPAPQQCSETVRNFSQCGGSNNYSSYPNTHLLLISEYTNTCTGAVRTVVSADWNLNVTCDPNLIGQCSSSNLAACDAVLAELQNRLVKISTQSTGGAGTLSIPLTQTPTPSPTQTPSPSPTPTTRVSSYSILMQREATSSSGSTSTNNTFKEVLP